MQNMHGTEQGIGGEQNKALRMFGNCINVDAMTGSNTVKELEENSGRTKTHWQPGDRGGSSTSLLTAWRCASPKRLGSSCGNSNGQLRKERAIDYDNDNVAVTINSLSNGFLRNAHRPWNCTAYKLHQLDCYGWLHLWTDVLSITRKRPLKWRRCYVSLY